MGRVVLDMRLPAAFLLLALGLGWTGCAQTRTAAVAEMELAAVSVPTASKPAAEPAKPQETTVPSATVFVAPDSLDTAVERIVGDMLASGDLKREQAALRVLVDAEHVRSSATAPTGDRALANHLRIELNRAANGRILFISRSLASIERQRRSAKGVDYRLEGSIEPNADASAAQGRKMALRLVGGDSNETRWSHQYLVADAPETP